MPSAVAAHSTLLGAYTATVSPGTTPASASQRATARISCANRPQLTFVHPLPERTRNRVRSGWSAARAITAHGAGFTVRNGVGSMASRPLGGARVGELLLEVEQAALELVELVQRTLLVAPRRQA